MKTYKININVVAVENHGAFKTMVRETARDLEEAKAKALDGWPAGSEITSIWEV